MVFDQNLVPSRSISRDRLGEHTRKLIQNSLIPSTIDGNFSVKSVEGKTFALMDPPPFDTLCSYFALANLQTCSIYNEIVHIIHNLVDRYEMIRV